MFETHCMILVKKQSNTVLNLICTNQYLVREVAGLVSFEIALGARGSIWDPAEKRYTVKTFVMCRFPGRISIGTLPIIDMICPVHQKLSISEKVFLSKNFFQSFEFIEFPLFTDDNSNSTAVYTKPMDP